jgi:effector-binding domain-containing protein
VPTGPSSQALLSREGLHRQLVVLPDAAVLAQEEEDPGGPGDLARLLAARGGQLDGELGRRQRTVASLRDLLAGPPADGPARIDLRSLRPAPAAAITEVVDAEDSVSWLQGALGELWATLAARNVPADGHPGGIFADDLFTHHRGQVTVFVPCAGTVRPVGRVTALVVPAAELAVITHSGPPADVDRAYAALATYVAHHALAVDGPIREYYLAGQRDTADTAQWRTEIGWPVFQTGAGAGPAAT